MFDDKIKVGTHIALKDSKNRIFISRKILTPEREELILVKETDMRYCLCSPKTFEKEIEKFNNKLDVYMGDEEREETIKRQLETLKKARRILMDKDGRITLNEELTEYDEILEIGGIDKIYLEPYINIKSK